MQRPAARRGDGCVQAVRELVCTGRGKSSESACTEDGARSDSAIHSGRKRGPGNLHGQASSCRCRRDVRVFDQPLEGPSRLFARTRTLSARVSESKIRKHPIRVLLGEGKFWTQAHPSDCAGHSLPRPAFYGPGLCRCCEATLREPLLRDRSGFDRLRARPGESRPRLLSDHSQRFAAGWVDGSERRHREKSCRGQNPFFARAGPRSHQAKVRRPAGLIGCRWRFMVSPDRRTASALLTILFFAIVLAVVYVARTVIVIFAFSILFAYLIYPIVRFLQRHSLFFKNLRGPHVLEAYLALIVFTLLLSHGLFPQFRKSAGQLLAAIPTLTDRVSSGEIASNLGSNLGWADEQADQIRIFLQRHRANVERAAATIEQFAPAALAGFVVIPILAIFFLNDGENIANQVIHLVSTRENHAALRSLADELHAMLQCYIRAKVILGGLSLLYCLIAMLLLGFPNAIVLGVLAGILEFIPVVGWMTAAATIVTAGALSHSHWIWILALLAVWRILMDYGIAPRVMGHELEIHPLLAIFALMVGGAVGGIVGIYLSVPLVAALRVIYRRFASPPVGATVPCSIVGSPGTRGEKSVMA